MSPQRRDAHEHHATLASQHRIRSICGAIEALERSVTNRDARARPPARPRGEQPARKRRAGARQRSAGHRFGTR